MCNGVMTLNRQFQKFESLTPTAATGITTSLLTNAAGLPAHEALITVESYQVRFRMDGTDPDADTGHVIAAGGSYVVTGIDALKALRFIDTTAGASTVRISVAY